MTFKYPAVATSLDGQRAILVDHLEDDRFREPNRSAFYVRGVVQLTPRSDPCWAKILTIDVLQSLWDAEGQQMRWALSFDKALPGLALLGIGDYLDKHDVSGQPEPTGVSFTVELTTEVFDVLQRKPATDDALVRFLKGKIYWAWRFKLPEARIELPDATRLGVTVNDVVHAAYRHEQQLWTRTDAQSFKPTPEFIRMMDVLLGKDVPEGKEEYHVDQVYQVALSFAGEQRDYVQAVANALTAAGVRVFYDECEDLWGVDLTKRLEDVYRRRSQYVVIFVSREYIEKAWPNFERQHALAGRTERRDDSVLPARFGALELPGLPATVGHLDVNHMPPAELARRIISKLRGDRR